MVALRAGLAVRRTNPLEAIDVIVRAEQAGVPMIWSTVGGTNPDAVTAFAAAAMRTSRIGFGSSIVPTYPRHPIALS
jgi:alkanesulfonate monooxygenase SsuD/methylene tetrahydromethanopterin reductase-like flavin-dependent oxidoreductase (luciferase family)